MAAPERSAFTIAAAAVLLAVIAVGLAAYTASRVSSIEKGQREINEKLEQLAGNVSRITSSLSEVQALREQVDSMQEILNQLSSKVAGLQGVQDEVASLRESLQEIRAQLESGQANITSLSRQLNEIAARIDRVYSLLLFPVTITDASGKPLTIPQRPERIVSLFPSVTEILWAVNASSQVIAVDSYSNYPPEVRELVENGTLVDIGSGWYPNVEKILSLQPDLVIGVASVPSNQDLKKTLADYGIPMILLPDKSFQDVLDGIILVGKATGHPAEAAALAARLKAEAAQLQAHVAEYLNTTGQQPAKVALLVWFKPIWVAGADTFQNDIITLAGGVNAYSNVTGWATVDPETLLAANPDVIVITAGHQGINMTRQDFIDYLAQLLGDAAYNITAVAQGRIYFLEGDYNDEIVRPGPRIVDAAYLLSVILYPQAYGLTPQDIPEKLNPQTFQPPTPPWAKP